MKKSKKKSGISLLLMIARELRISIQALDGLVSNMAWTPMIHEMVGHATRVVLILGFDEMLVSGSEWQTAEAPVGLDSVWKFLESSSRYPSLISTT